MSFALTNAGAAEMLSAYFGSRKLTLRLFTNAREPKPGDTAQDYSEPTGGGYRAIDLSPENWAIVDGVAEHPEVMFRFNGKLDGGSPVRGHMLTNESGTVIMAQLASEPFELRQNGGMIALTPHYEIGDR